MNCSPARSVHSGAASRCSSAAGHSRRPVLTLLARLVNASLVVAEPQAGQVPRYHLLETLRADALERSRADGEAVALRERHATHFAGLAEAAGGHLEGPAQGEWLRILARDHENLRTALAWLLTSGAVERGLRLASALWQYWWLSGHVAEGRDSLATLLAQVGSDVAPGVHARALTAAATLARHQADYTAAQTLGERGLTQWRCAADPRGIAGALNHLAIVALHTARLVKARELFGRVLRSNRRLADRQVIADAIGHLGQIALYEGEPAQASELLNQALEQWRSLGDHHAVC